MIEGSLNILQHYARFGPGAWLVLFILFMVLYLNLKILLLLWHYFEYKNEQTWHQLRIVLRAAGFVFLIFMIAMPLLGIGLEYVTTNQAHLKVINKNNDLLLEADKDLFGVYLPFWFQDRLNPYKPWLDLLARPLVMAYKSLVLALGLLFIVLIVRQEKLFLEMLAVFVLCILFSLPLWSILPALSPIVYLRPENLSQTPIEIQEVVARYEPNRLLATYQAQLLHIRAQGPPEFLQITTIPSMHIAWVTAFLVIAVRAYKWLAIVAVPYFVLNIVSTIYTLQHYAVDTPAGIAVALAAMAGAHFLVTKWQKTNPARITLTHLLQEDLRKFGWLVSNKVKRGLVRRSPV